MMQTNRLVRWGMITLGVLAFFCLPKAADAARLFLTPATGSFPVGETFTLKVFIDTEGEQINALDLRMSFPADKVQLVSPNTSVSLIDVWASQPKYNNRTGEISMQGGIPNGIATSAGLVTELTFRVRSTGQALIEFSSESEVYLNDGKATPAGVDYQNTVLQLELPPPAGPAVTSATHPIGKWSTNPQVAFSWFNAGDDGYSFVLDQSPITEPDTIVDSTQPQTFYDGMQAGINFFHVRALRGGVWGGTTHYELKVDDQPPAEFQIDLFPSARTSVRQPTISFRTSDAHSGISYYELNIMPLSPMSGDTDQTSFIEVTSPYIAQELDPGPYEVIVRAHDWAGNTREVSRRFYIAQGLLTLSAGEGVIIRDVITIPWFMFAILMLLLAAFVAREVWVVRRLRQEHARLMAAEKKDSKKGKRRSSKVPEEVATELEELKQYRKKYGHLVVLLALLVGGLGLAPQASAQTPDLLVDTPQVTSWSQFITNQEIFYLRGVAGARTQSVTVYVQDVHDGSLESFTVPVGEQGEWLYRHNNLVSPGEYAVWVQGVAGQETSPPSARYEIVVEREALRLGASQVSLATLYATGLMLLLVVLALIWGRAKREKRRVRQRRAAYLKEAEEARQAVRHGFAMLYKDLAAHLKDIKEKTAAGTLDLKDLQIEEAEILADLDRIQHKIGKEVADIEEILRDDSEKLQDQNEA